MRTRRKRIWGPLAMSGLGLLACLVAVALFWDGRRTEAWFVLVIAALEAVLTAHEVSLRWQGGRVQDRWVGAAPFALGVGVIFLLAAILG